MIRIGWRNKYALILSLLLIPFILPADDLNRASLLEKEGRSDEARALYLLWLKAEENRESPSYGRTLLHLLRMGGDSQELLEQLDNFLPGVGNPQDRNEILKFAGYLADLTGDSSRSAAYFSSLSGDGRLDWIRDYNSMAEGSAIPPDDPLLISFQTADQNYIKNKALIYLLFLNSADKDKRTLINWQEQAEVRFPFLREYPEWYYISWYCYSGIEEESKVRDYRAALLNRFPSSPEAALIRGRIRLMVNPSFFIFSEPRDTAAADPLPDDTISYLQAGAFGTFANAAALQKAISEKTGLSAEIRSEDSVFKVVVKTLRAEQDMALLKELGFDVFRILPADH